ncbi:MAG TPA: nitrilase-related carbon-nitrogen hydrolase, partial [Anaerolineae bacterium]
MQIRVAGAQICVTNNIQANQENIVRAIDFAAADKADILLTPEGSLSGYTPHFDQLAVDKALQAVTDYASRAKVGLALGTCYIEPSDG